MKAKKSFGQHFLAQPQIARQIAYSFDLSEVEQMIEVGPGQGMLTQFLLEREVPTIAIEADRDMVESLQERFPAWASEHVVSEDFLKVDLHALTQGKQTALVGNFPYNISSQIIVRLVDHRSIFPVMVGMFQRELAERVLSPPGSKAYGAIGVLAQAYYSGSIVMHVKPGSFNPPPKVNSTVIQLSRKPTDQQPDCNEATFRKIVRTVFQQRRKMLRNSLKSIWQTDIDQEDKAFQRRPEQLSIKDFAALARQLDAQG